MRQAVSAHRSKRQGKKHRGGAQQQLPTGPVMVACQQNPAKKKKWMSETPPKCILDPRGPQIPRSYVLTVSSYHQGSLSVTTTDKWTAHMADLRSSPSGQDPQPQVAGLLDVASPTLSHTVGVGQPQAGRDCPTGRKSQRSPPEAADKGRSLTELNSAHQQFPLLFAQN